MSDIAFISIREGWLYLAVTLNLLSRTESLFHALKTKLVHHEACRSRTEAEASIFEYIEVFYNRPRSHSHSGFMALLAFERAALSAQ